VVKKLLRVVIPWLVEVKNTTENYGRRQLKREKQWLSSLLSDRLKC